MNAETWRRVEAIVDSVADLAASEREPLLDERCGNDPKLRHEVKRILDALDAGGDFLDCASWAPPRALDDEEDRPGSGRTDKELPRGFRVGAYRVEGFVGHGGMGAVYRARRDDDAFDKTVALKIVRGDLDGEAARRRFERERFLLARLEHPNISRLYDAGATDDGRPFFVMELVEGEPLDRYCDRHELGVRDRLELFLQVCGAIRHAHRNLIIHRDLKPSNILVTAAGEAKLLDFGLAKLVNGAGSKSDLTLTAPQQRPMTPLYASPEQFNGKALTTATDVYGLGLLLFRLLTGRLPYPENAGLDLPHWITEVDPPAPSSVVGGVDQPLPGLPGRTLAAILGGDLDAIVLKALRKEPESRYGSVGEFAEDLRRYRSDQPVLARRGTRRYYLWKFLRRHRMALAATVAAFLLTLGFAIAMARQVGLTANARDQALGERDQAVRVSGFLVEIFEVSHPETGFGTVLTSRQLIDLAAGRLDRQATGQPVLRARLLNTMGQLYRNLGEVDRARKLLEEGRRIRGEVLGRDHPDTVASDLDLARLAFDAGDYQESERLAREAASFGDESTQGAVLTADSALLVGKARQQIGHPAEAAEHYRAALELYDRHLPESDRRLATAFDLLGQILARIGKVAEAEKALDRALELTTQQFGEEHPATASILLDLSEIYRRSARFSESLHTVQRAIKIFSRFLPDEHPIRLEALSYLGAALGALGKHEESVQVRRKLLAGAARRFGGGDHFNHAIALNELAVALTAAGEMAEAIALHKRSLAMKRRLFGDHHRAVAQSHFSLGLALGRDGRPSEAERNLRQSIALLDAIPGGRDFPETGLYYTELARLLIQRGAAAEAEPLARSGRENFGRGYSASHPKVLEAATIHAAALSAVGRLEEAEEILSEALTAAEKPGAPSSRFTVAARELLDEVCEKLTVRRAGPDAQ